MRGNTKSTPCLGMATASAQRSSGRDVGRARLLFAGEDGFLFWRGRLPCGPASPMRPFCKLTAHGSRSCPSKFPGAYSVLKDSTPQRQDPDRAERANRQDASTKNRSDSAPCIGQAACLGRAAPIGRRGVGGRFSHGRFSHGRFSHGRFSRGRFSRGRFLLETPEVPVESLDESHTSRWSLEVFNKMLSCFCSKLRLWNLEHKTR